MEIYEKKLQNQSDKDHVQSKEAINLNITDAKNGTPIETNNTISEDENSFKDNDLNTKLNTKDSKETRPNLDVISPSNDTEDNVILKENRTQFKNSPGVSPDFGVYKSVSKLTNFRKRSEKRRKMTRKTWLKL